MMFSILSYFWVGFPGVQPCALFFAVEQFIDYLQYICSALFSCWDDWYWITLQSCQFCSSSGCLLSIPFLVSTQFLILNYQWIHIQLPFWMALQFGQSAMMVASWEGHLGIVETLLSADADPNLQEGVSHFSSIYC